MSAPIRFRDFFRRYVPPWLSDRGSILRGSVGYAFLWSMIAPLDKATDVLVQGADAALPGLGTPTALPWIGRMRGILRGQGESDASYALRLVGWLDGARRLGSAEAICNAVYNYLSSKPKVRVVTRHGFWVTRNTDGTFEYATHAWDWDSLSNPERSGNWWDEWVIVYATQWATTPTIGTGTIGRQTGIGHLVTQDEHQTVVSEVMRAKSAHSNIRSIIWSYNAADFHPDGTGLQPDGTWGTWGYGTAPHAPSRSDTCRFWEPV